MINRAVAFLALSALVAAGCAQTSPGSGGAAGTLPDNSAKRGSSTPFTFSHVIIVVQENRSFDNFFATFPGADGATEGCMKNTSPSRRLPSSRPLSSSGCPPGDTEIALKEGGLTFDSLGHEHFSFEKEFDNGKMDGFNLVQRALRKGYKIPAGTYGYRYVNPAQIAPYWTIAQQWVLADHMFTTQGSSSFTAHQDIIAGGTPVGDKGYNVIDFPSPSSWGCNAKPGTVTSIIGPKGNYKRDQGPFPCFTYETVRDLLDNAGLTWLYFTNTSNADVWNAFDAIKAVREGSEWSTNIVIPETKIFQTIQYGELPNVAWVIPDAVNSDHPGNHSDTGPSWVADVVNAVGESSYWDSSVVIVVWDDWGGEYDNVPPPQLDGQGLGMRVPMLIVSPYDRETSSSQLGYISHTQYEFGSILKFMEQNWGLGSLGTSDVRANSIIDSFDFTQAPRPFTPISTKYSKAFFERQKPSGLPLDDE